MRAGVEVLRDFDIDQSVAVVLNVMHGADANSALHEFGGYVA
jgi:hypothetical protein